MGFLESLNITQLKRSAALSPAQHRRKKLVAKLEEQLALVRAQAEGKRYVVVTPAWTRDEDGNKHPVQKERLVRAWWWNDGGALTMVVRYGARQIELSKGKKAISVPDIGALPGTIGTLIQAVNAGELDAAISEVVGVGKVKAARK